MNGERHSALVDELWRSTDMRAEARVARGAMSEGNRNLLCRIAEALERRAAARRVLASDDVDAEPAEFVGLTDESIEGSCWFSCTLAAYHSDSLAYLPFEQRETRLRQWAQHGLQRRRGPKRRPYWDLLALVHCSGPHDLSSRSFAFKVTTDL